MDTTGPFTECLPQYKYLHGAVDDFSGKMFGQFSSTGTKTQMKNFAEKVIKKCEGEKKQVKYIRIDGGGENKGIEDLVEEISGITIEKTLASFFFLINFFGATVVAKLNQVQAVSLSSINFFSSFVHAVVTSALVGSWKEESNACFTFFNLIRSTIVSLHSSYSLSSSLPLNLLTVTPPEAEIPTLSSPDMIVVTYLSIAIALNESNIYLCCVFPISMFQR